MSEEPRPVVLAGVALGPHPHVCAFFADKGEEVEYLLAFVREGIEAAEKAVHVVAPQLRGEHIEQLRRGGIDVQAAQRSGQLEILTTEEVYLGGGRFDLERTMTALQGILDRGRADGYPRTRLIAEAPWGLGTVVDPQEFMAYEARLTRRLQGYGDPVVCCYEVTRLDAPLVFDVLRTHPVAMVDGVGHVNPFFGPVREFMSEIVAPKPGR
jgi:hypothetical protein